ncbi:U6 snRNA phosphodiesterase 1-like isoform X2 [Rhopilema esculentum]
MLLPIPNDVLSMFKDVASSEESADDHKGRIRSFAHEEGNWASYVFIPAKLSNSQKALIKSLVDRARKTFSKFEQIDNKAIHITLSKTVSLRHYWIEPLVDQLKDLLSNTQSFRCHLDLVELYTNEEKTRSFLGLRIILGEEKLKALTEKVDQVLEKFGLPKYYENPSFHISFAWHLGDVTNTVPPTFTEDLQNLVDSFDAEWSEDENYMNFRTLNVDNICLKTGNKVYYIKR